LTIKEEVEKKAAENVEKIFKAKFVEGQDKCSWWLSY